MFTCARVMCVLTLLATPAAARSTTDEGIRAMVRGDYQAAARILRPLADPAAPPDPVAQFLLAILYDTGHGGDTARACGLFLRAATPANPFREQSRQSAFCCATSWVDRRPGCVWRTRNGRGDGRSRSYSRPATESSSLTRAPL